MDYIHIDILVLEINLNIESLITLFIIAQGLFASAILFTSKSNITSNRILAVLILAIDLWLIDAFFGFSGSYGRNPDLYFKPIYYSFAFGPLIYLYVKSLVNSEFKFTSKYLLHFIPVLLQSMLYWILTFQDYETKRLYWENVHYPVTYRIEFDGTFLSLFVYLIISIKLLFRYQNWLKEQFSEFSKVHLNWLKVVLTIILVLSCQWLAEVILRDYFDQYHYNYSVLLLGVLSLVLAFGGILQSNLEKIKFKPKKKSTAPALLDEEITRRIVNSMENDQYFLNPSLSLKDFSEAIRVPSRTISGHINQGLNCSFVEFVNGYRIAEFKRRLSQSNADTMTILGHALESGFNSKSSFNRIFKKHEGVSPSEYASK